MNHSIKKSEELISFSAQLNRFFENSRLSLSQIARKLEISKGHLSEIRNGKALPSLDLGLKILKVCGIDSTERRRWVEKYNCLLSEEYESIVCDEQSVGQKRKLTHKIGKLFAQDLDLFNLYLDIVDAGAEGVEKGQVQQDYGKKLLKKVQFLIRSGLIREENEIFFSDGSSDFVLFDRESSFDFVKTYLDNEKQGLLERDPSETTRGKFQFLFEDIDQSSYLRLLDLYEEFMRKSSEVLKKSRKQKKDGGKRFIVQALIGRLHSITALMLFPTLLLVSLSATTVKADFFTAEAGGGGGSSFNQEPITVSSSWDVILSSKKYYSDFPVFRAVWPDESTKKKDHSLPLQYNEFCIVDSPEGWLRTIEPREVCLKRGNSCKFVTDYVFLPPYELVNVCTDYNKEKQECDRHEEISLPVKLSVDVDVYEILDDGDEKRLEKKFTKKYLTPPCSKFDNLE